MKAVLSSDLYEQCIKIMARCSIRSTRLSEALHEVGLSKAMTGRLDYAVLYNSYGGVLN